MKARNNCAAGLPRSWKSQRKTKNVQGQGKIFDVGKVSEKSGNSVFRFIANQFLHDFSIHFFFWKRLNVCCKARKAINLTLDA